MKTMRIHSVWPTLNKQDTLARYVEQVRAMDFVPCQAEIAETIYLTIGEWEAFTKHLLDDRSWLSGKGGCTERGVRSVLLVVRPGETAQESLGILVDPQGYDYARYVGFYLDPERNLITNPPNLLPLSDIMGTTLNGKTYSQRVLGECHAY